MADITRRYLLDFDLELQKLQEFASDVREAKKPVEDLERAYGEIAARAKLAQIEINALARSTDGARTSAVNAASGGKVYESELRDLATAQTNLRKIQVLLRQATTDLEKAYRNSGQTTAANRRSVEDLRTSYNALVGATNQLDTRSKQLGGSIRGSNRDLAELATVVSTTRRRLSDARVELEDVSGRLDRLRSASSAADQSQDPLIQKLQQEQTAARALVVDLEELAIRQRQLRTTPAQTNQLELPGRSTAQLSDELAQLQQRTNGAREGLRGLSEETRRSTPAFADLGQVQALTQQRIKEVEQALSANIKQLTALRTQTEPLSSEQRELASALEQQQTTLIQLSNGYRVLNAEQKDISVGTRSYRANIAQLEEQLATLRQITRTNVDEAQELAEGTLQESNAFAQLKIAASETTSTITRLNREYATIQRQLLALRSGNRELTDSEKQLETALESQLADVARLRVEYTNLRNEQQKVTSDVNRAFGGLSGALRNINAGTRAVLGSLGQVGTQLSGLTTIAAGVSGPAVVLVGALAGIAAGSSKAVSEATELEFSLSRLSALTGITGDNFEFLTNRVLDLGAATNRSANEVAEGFLLVASTTPQFLNNAQALSDLTEASITLSNAGGVQLTSAVETVSKAINTYRLEASEAASVTNILSEAQRRGAAFIPQLNEGLITSAATAAAVNQDFQTTVSAIEALAQGGIIGRRAGSGLAIVLRELASASDEYNVRSRGLVEVVNQLAEDNVTYADAVDLVGRRGARYLAVLIQQRNQLNELSGSLDVNNAALLAAAERTDNVRGEFQRLGSSLNTLFARIGSGTTGPLNRLLRRLTETTIRFQGASAQLEFYNRQLDIATARSNRYALESRELTSEITKLQGQIALNADDQARLNSLTAELLRDFPELVQSYDAQTGAVEINTAAIRENIDARAEQADAIRREALEVARAAANSARGQLGQDLPSTGGSAFGSVDLPNDFGDILSFFSALEGPERVEAIGNLEVLADALQQVSDLGGQLTEQERIIIDQFSNINRVVLSRIESARSSIGSNEGLEIARDAIIQAADDVDSLVSESEGALSRIDARDLKLRELIAQSESSRQDLENQLRDQIRSDRQAGFGNSVIQQSLSDQIASAQILESALNQQLDVVTDRQKSIRALISSIGSIGGDGVQGAGIIGPLGDNIADQLLDLDLQIRDELERLGTQSGVEAQNTQARIQGLFEQALSISPDITVGAFGDQGQEAINEVFDKLRDIGATDFQFQLRRNPRSGRARRQQEDPLVVFFRRQFESFREISDLEARLGSNIVSDRRAAEAILEERENFALRATELVTRTNEILQDAPESERLNIAEQFIADFDALAAVAFPGGEAFATDLIDIVGKVIKDGAIPLDELIGDVDAGSLNALQLRARELQEDINTAFSAGNIDLFTERLLELQQVQEQIDFENLRRSVVNFQLNTDDERLEQFQDALRGVIAEADEFVLGFNRAQDSFNQFSDNLNAAPSGNIQFFGELLNQQIDQEINEIALNIERNRDILERLLDLSDLTVGTPQSAQEILDLLNDDLLRSQLQESGIAFPFDLEFQAQRVLNGEILNQEELALFQSELQTFLDQTGAQISVDTEGLVEDQIRLARRSVVITQIFSSIASGVQLAFDGVAQGIQNTIALLDGALQSQQRRVDLAVEDARRGNAEALAFERSRLEELERERERSVRRQQRLAKIEAAANLLIGVSQIFATPTPADLAPGVGTALKIAQAAALVGGFVAQTAAGRSAVQNFYTGTPFVTGERGIDKIPSMLTYGEAVIPTRQNAKYPGLTKALINDDFENWLYNQSGLISQGILPPTSGVPGVINQVTIDVEGLKEEQRRTREAIENQPVSSFYFDENGVRTLTKRQARDSERLDKIR